MSVGHLTPVLLSVILLCSCVVGPDYAPPQLTPAQQFHAERDRGLVDGTADLADWWEVFDDPVLNGLVQRALEGNLDLKESLARIQESRALRGIEATTLYPTIDVTGSSTRVQTSEETALGSFGIRRNNQFEVGLNVTWELDIWGKNQRAVEAAQGDLEASIEETRAVLVLVVAEVARNYVELRMFQERLRIAEANVLLQSQTLELTENAFKANLVSRLDVDQAESNLASTRATVPVFFGSARAARNRLAVLLGVFPGELEQELQVAKPIPAPPAEVAVGIPADVIRRRPDIRRTERELAAQTARIGVATAELYPRLTLVGSVGVAAEDVADLSRSGATLFRFGPSLSWNIFNRSRIRDGIRVEDARTEQALANYEHTVLQALEEVENAITFFVHDQVSRDHLQRAVISAKSAVERSRERYRQGLASFQSVIDTQSRLFLLEDRLSTTHANVSADLIALYKSLGGGWESRDVILQARTGQ